MGRGWAEDFDRLVVHRHDAVVVHQKGAFDDGHSLLAGDRLGDEDGEFVARQIRVADDALAGEGFVEVQDIEDRVSGKGEADIFLAGLELAGRGQGGSDGGARREDLGDLLIGIGRGLSWSDGGHRKNQSEWEQDGSCFHGPGTGWAAGA